MPSPKASINNAAYKFESCGRRFISDVITAPKAPSRLIFSNKKYGRTTFVKISGRCARTLDEGESVRQLIRPSARSMPLEGCKMLDGVELCSMA